VLRISEELRWERETRLRLEGNLVDQWIEVVQSSCLQVLERGGELQLDLAGIGFADLEGVDLLRRLDRRGVQMINCPAFLREQLRESSTGIT
jgi:hypothetical protein